MIGLTVLTKTAEEWMNSFAAASEFVREEASRDRHVSMWTSSSSDIIEDAEEVYHDENTLFKASSAIEKAVADYVELDQRSALVDSVVTSLLNAGILFRERSR
jgi:hypothetical protein